MSFFQRLFSPEYRKALAAEAAGDFLEAARSYALCGETDKVCDMHLARARRATSLDDRIISLRNALAFAALEHGRYALVARLLAEALERLGDRQGARTAEGRQSLREAGQLLLRGERYEAAGECFVRAGDEEAAVDAFSRAGLVERVEELLEELDEDRGRARRLDARFKDYELNLGGGNRDAALSALEDCIEAAEQKGSFRRLHQELESRLLKSGRVILVSDGDKIVLASKRTFVIGRDSDCDFVVRGPSVSRQHTRIRYDGDLGRFVVEDAGSRNGTQLSGLPIGGRVELPDQAKLALGDSAKVEVTDHEGILELRVTSGMDRGRRGLFWGEETPPRNVALGPFVPAFPGLSISFRDGRPVVKVISNDTLHLNGAKVTEAQLITEDQLTLEGCTLKVSR